MAKRKKKLTRKQRKEQRRAAMARVREERGWKPPPPQPVLRDDVVDDMLPLFSEMDDSSEPLYSMEQVMITLVASADLADEPEFEDIIIEPFLCMTTFVKAGVEMGHDPDSLLELSEEEREDVHADMLVETVQRLLTDELRQDILDGLDKLRLRLRRAGNREDAARAAALQSFLSGDVESEMWAMIGLVQAIFNRSVGIGFEMAEASAEVWEAEDAGDDPATLMERLSQSSVGRKTESLLKRVPGLSKYLSRHADTTWDEGAEAILEGELYLGLFEEEELAVGLDLFRQSLGSAIEEATSQGLDEVEMPVESAKDFVSRVDDYVAGLFTPERLDQLRARLDAVLKERAFEGKWLPFVLMLKQYMAEPDAAENERYFLIRAFLGEFRYVGREITEASG